MTRSGGTRPPPDLRLFGAALGAWAACLAGLHVSVVSSITVAGIAVVVATVAALVARWLRVASGRGFGGRPVAWAVTAVALGVACGSLATAARAVPREAEPLAWMTRDRVTAAVELTVTGDPSLLAGGRPGPPTYLVPARLERVESDRVTARLDAQVVVFATDPAWRTMLPSQRVATRARLAPPRGGDLTAAALTATGSPQRLGSPSWSQVAADRLRAGLQAACAPLPPEPGGLLPGLVIGDTSRLDPALEEAFRTTGLTHLVAVSGLNDRDQQW